MDSHESWHAWGIATVAVVIAFASLMISSGSCAGQDRNESKIDHLEQRLDNLRDGK